MKKHKVNIILEVNRIHQLMGVKKDISEQVQASLGGTLIKIAADIIQNVAGKNLDDASQGLVSQLRKGTKDVIDKEGKKTPRPFTEEDYIRIFNNLKKNGTDLGIVRILDKYQAKISEAIRTESIPKLLNSKILRDSIQSGVNNPKIDEDIVVDQVANIIRRRYGIYADDIVMDDFVDQVRNIYKELKGKVDNVVDDVTPNPENVVDDVTPNPENVVDDVIPSVEEVGPNISKEINEISPTFTKYSATMMDKGAKIADEITSNIELLAKEKMKEKPDGIRIEELQKKIKEGYDNLFYSRKEYIRYIQNEIEAGIEAATIKKDKALLAKWQSVQASIKTTQEKFGDWGVILKTIPQSGKWTVWSESWRSAISLERKIFGDVLYRKILRPGWRKFQKWWNEDYRPPAKIKDIPESELAGLKQTGNWFIWGTPRGIPTRMKGKELLDDNGNPIKGVNIMEPNAYKKIFQRYQNNSMAKAWISFVLEKLIRSVKLHLELSVLYFAKDFGNFLAGTDKEIMITHGPCIMEISEKFKSGEINLTDDFELIEANLPPCLIELLNNGLDDETLQKMLIRANFFATSVSGSEPIQLLINRLTDMSLGDAARSFLIPPPSEFAYRIYTDIYKPWIDSERTGLDTPLDDRINRVREEIRGLEAEGFTLEFPNTNNEVNDDGAIIDTEQGGNTEQNQDTEQDR